MNPWMGASVLLLMALPPCGWLALTRPEHVRLVALDMASVICTLELMLLTVAFGRFPMMDLPVALALLSFGSGMLFAHFLAKDL
jgi:multisubunit Na+/H+ antiporter MnhF subunit